MNYGAGQQIGYSLNVNFEMWIVYVFLFIFFVIFLVTAKIIVKKIAKKNTYHDHTIFMVRLPKERPGDKERDFTVQSLHEEIAKAETIFASIGG